MSKLTNSSILACLDVNVKRRLLGKRNDLLDICLVVCLWLECDGAVMKQILSLLAIAFIEDGYVAPLNLLDIYLNL